MWRWCATTEHAESASETGCDTCACPAVPCAADPPSLSATGLFCRSLHPRLLLQWENSSGYPEAQARCSVHGAHCGDHPQHAGRRGGRFQGGCSGGDKGRVGGAPGVTTCERLLGTRVRRGPSLLFRLPMSSCGHELERTGKSFLQLPRLRSQPPPCSLPPSFIYGTAISFRREVASIMKWQKDLNENKVFA